jgi:hypothetical protein
MGPRHKGRKKVPYYVTTLGLLKALTHDMRVADIHLIVKKNTDKALLIFKEWDYFEKRGTAQKVVDALKYLHVSIQWKANGQKGNGGYHV